VRRLTQLSARFGGVPVSGTSPGWRGHLGADKPFAALALVQAGTTVFWGKAEIAAHSALPVILHLYPPGSERTPVQVLFTLGSRMIAGVLVSFQAGQLPSVRVSPAPAGAGRAFRLCAFESQPPCACFAFLLAAADVSAGRTGTWRPRERLRRVLPGVLEPALFGASHGLYSTSAAASETSPRRTSS
jgi:hypothetical protein